MRYVNACEHGNWHLMIWKPGEPHKARPVCYRCHSWRHDGDCCRWKGAQDFARIKQAILSRPQWVYIVLTFAQRDWADPRRQYTDGGPMWSALRCRLRRLYGKIEYIQTWERHKKGGAHVNVLLSNPYIFDQVVADWRHWRKHILEPHAVAVGFGKRTYVETLRTKTEASMAGYLVKLASELTGADGKSQIPFDAPPHFRRLRSSPGLLPPVIKGEFTGQMIFRPMPEGVVVDRPEQMADDNSDKQRQDRPSARPVHQRRGDRFVRPTVKQGDDVKNPRSNKSRKNGK